MYVIFQNIIIKFHKVTNKKYLLSQILSLIFAYYYLVIEIIINLINI